LVYTPAQFAVWSEMVKRKFDYSQGQIELVATFGNVGGYFSVFSGMFFDRFGARWTALVV
jgi:nitrate/nitrite transporter NarK